METRSSLYKPIAATDFRVVHLLPGTFSDEIRCVLETRPCHVKTVYEALSYQWGDDSVRKPIHIAHLSPSPRRHRMPDTRPTWLRSSVRTAAVTVQAAAARYRLYRAIQLLSWSISTYLIWAFVSPLPLDPAPWASRLMSRNACVMLASMVCGVAPFNLAAKACKLGAEVAKTKPWGLVYNARFTVKQQLDFETLQVPPNLSLALRHLRLETRPRTLWIDALCINQADEDEKRMQIQRMDWVYANASPIIVWLGGYHGIQEASSCADGSDCLHRRQIEAAFHLFHSLSGWRLLAPWYFNRDKEDRYRAARPGLCDLYKRGWWERLWVIQEVALATGPVRLQCGHDTCDFDRFRSAQHAILRDHRGDKAIDDGSSAAQRLTATVNDFRHSPFHDLEGLLPKSLYGGMVKVSGLFGQDAHSNEVQFHDQPFAGRLQRVLLRTAGQFQCRDNRDRLYAVLGIAGGARSGQATAMADLVRYLSSFSTAFAIGHAMAPLVKVSPGLPFQIAAFAFGLAHASWACFYEEKAKHWTISRPEYIVTGYREVIDTVTGGRGQRTSRVEFFTALAQYLANKTKTLAFLDAATCGTDQDDTMPSWVPNWTREVGRPAYDFSMRPNKDWAGDRFAFADNGKTLCVMGMPKGTVHVVRSVADPAAPTPPWLFQQRFENWLALPAEGKAAAAAALELIHATLHEPAGPQRDGAKELIALSRQLIRTLLGLGAIFLRQGGGTLLVYSFDGKAKEMGFLKAGEAARGDRMVFVPGCFHHLVLRRQGEPVAAGNRWKLVGLVALGTPFARGGCSEAEWARLRKDGALFKYTIV